MNEATPPAAPDINPEFFIRVNDFIEMANRIERRFDTHHAETAMTHAFSRYSAHHYRTTAKGDDAINREAYASYISGVVKGLVLSHLEELMGPVAAAEAPKDSAAE